MAESSRTFRSKRSQKLAEIQEHFILKALETQLLLFFKLFKKKERKTIRIAFFKHLSLKKKTLFADSFIVNVY